MIVGITLILPFTPLARVLGFSRLPPVFFVMLGVIVVLYMGMADVVKRIFYKVVKF